MVFLLKWSTFQENVNPELLGHMIDLKLTIGNKSATIAKLSLTISNLRYTIAYRGQSMVKLYLICNKL